MDTWMGRNHDPITLHKYLYANADPVSNVDPSGYFGISQVTGALRSIGVMAMRATRATNTLFQKALGAGGAAVRGGAAFVLARVPSFLRILAKQCRVKNTSERGNMCTYAKGFVKAELKLRLLAWSTPSVYAKNRYFRTISAAFDVKTTQAPASFNLGSRNLPKIAGPLLSHIEKDGIDASDLGSSMPMKANRKCSNRLGACAEFLAANNLLRSPTNKLSRIRWTLAYDIDTSGTFVRLGSIKNYCGNCKMMFALKNSKR